MQIWCPAGFRFSQKKMESSLFYDWKHHFQLLGRGGAVKIFSETIIQLLNYSVTKLFVEQPGYTGSVNNSIPSFRMVYCQIVDPRTEASEKFDVVKCGCYTNSSSGGATYFYVKLCWLSFFLVRYWNISHSSWHQYGVYNKECQSKERKQLGVI